eukprot:Nk52_evm7s162 gene=Nk52_evmTU7s162
MSSSRKKTTRNEDSFSFSAFSCASKRSRKIDCNGTPSATSISNRPTRGSTSSRKGASAAHSVVESSATGRVPSNVIVALAEGRGIACEIGMACIDLSQPKLILSQFTDSGSYAKVITKLEHESPSKIIMPSTACEHGKMTRLYKVLVGHFSSSSLVTVGRKYFNESQGLDTITSFCTKDSFDKLESHLSTKYYSLATAAALFKYVEIAMNVIFSANTLQLRYSGIDNAMLIDSRTVKNLELIHNLRETKSFNSLFGMMNHTKTPMGSRLLRSNIIQPPTSLETITMRLDCVDELLESEEVFFNLQSLLSQVLDLEQIAATLIQIPKQETMATCEANINGIIAVKHVLQLMEPLRDAITSLNSPIMQASVASLSDPSYQELLTEIENIITEETNFQKGFQNMRFQRCFAVKPNVNGLLDVARRTYSEAIEEVHSLVSRIAAEENLPIKIQFSASKGFYMSLPKKNVSSQNLLPHYFIQVVNGKTIFSFTVEDLIKYNDRIRQSVQEIYLMTAVATADLLTTIREKVSCLYNASSSIAIIDMMVSFAHLCTISDYVKPEFTSTVAIKGGRHPIIEKIRNEEFITNDTFVNELCSFQIITGPNMSGKSTYLKQVALLHIMGHIGSFVPAEYASLCICDQIFTRIGCDDELESNASSFMIEMKEASYILSNFTERSLVIIDELGRGTTQLDGEACCFAICEQLILRKTFTLMATHFQSLIESFQIYPNVECFHLLSEATENGLLTFKYQLQKGKNNLKNYGITIAGMTSLNPKIVELACSYMEQLSLVNKKKAIQTVLLSKDKRRQDFAFKIVNFIQESKLSDEHCLNFLNALIEDYADLFEKS